MADGFKGNIENIDICEHVIELMRVRNSKVPTLTYSVMDCTELTYKDGTFDAVIDKGARSRF